jgi:hypothetical protein
MELPAGECKIWRYTSLAKFVRLIQKQALYFASASQLEDKFEGSLTTPSFETFRKLMIGEHPALTVEMADTAPLLLMRSVAVNCWHLSDHESYVMWSRYATKEDGGVAIQSTVERLSKSFPASRCHVWIGSVKYIDYKQDEFEIVRDIKQWFLHKRKPFSAEQELRAMILNLPAQGTSMKVPPFPGTEIPCDVSTLIQSIYVAPTGPTFMLELIDDLCKRFGLSAPVSSSELADVPPSFHNSGS